MKELFDSQVIVDIIHRRIGAENAINQYAIADEYILATGDKIEARTVRRIIEALRFEGYPILSTPHEPGGYFYPASRREYFDWRDREMAKAKRQMAKLRPVGFGVYKHFRPHILQQVLDFREKIGIF